MELVLLVDFGSTFTKVTAVDLQEEQIIGTARSFSTVDVDIMEGFFNALKELEGSAGLKNPPYQYKIASSSAAGGLKMVAVGLVPELTAEAAKRAALGAGARILDVFAHELNQRELIIIEGYNPDIILLAGGTDGGNKSTLIHNAGVLASSHELTAPIVVAGNKSAADTVTQILQKSGKNFYMTENVMPELNALNIEPARQVIRHIFLDRIVEARGLKKAEKFIDQVLMPTPAAVLKAAELLAKGAGQESGLGELLAVDVGGATTDVYSVAGGDPTKPGVTLKGLEEPFVKRTIEGDLGMRYSLQALIERAGLENMLRSSGGITRDKMEEYIKRGVREPFFISNEVSDKEIDTLIGYTAVDIATQRHCGQLEVVYTPFGASYVQQGKDLTNLNLLVGTGGVITFHEHPEKILRGAIFNQLNPMVLKPIKPKMLVDRHYIMAGMGLLSELAPECTVRMLKKYLYPVSSND